MGTSSFVDAKSIQVEQSKETSEEYIDVYCILCFSPYQKQEEEFQNNISNKYRQDSSLIKKEIENQIINEQSGFIGDFLFPRVAYVSDLCGANKGKVVESQKIFIDCSRTIDRIQLNTEDVLELIKRAECEIRKILEKYWFKAKYVTLHLATYSFTLTEDIANCFLYSVYPSPQFYPEDNNLFSYFVDEHYSQLLKTYHDKGMNIEIEYVLVYDAEPFLQTTKPLEATITKNYCTSPTNSNNNSQPDALSLTTNTSQATINHGWPTNAKGAFELSAVKYEYNPDLVLKNEPDGKWSWKASSEILHSSSQGSSQAFGVLGVAALVVAGIAGVVAVVATGGTAAPVALAIAGGSLKFATAMGTASLAATTVDGYTYLADYVIDNDETALKEGQKVMGEELLWQGLTYGVAHGVKAKFGGKTILGKNLKSTRTEELKGLKNSESVVKGELKTVETRMNNRAEAINSNKQTKRNRYQKNKKRLEIKQNNDQLKQKGYQDELNNILKEQNRINEEIKIINEGNEIILDSTSRLPVDSIKVLINNPNPPQEK